jgi:serine/threonine-protein kinase
MGTVFLAEQIGVGNRLVALKVLNRKLLDDPGFLLRFQNEAASTGRIHHPNVVSIFESAQGDDGTPYIAMEFLKGESLRETLQGRGALPLPEVAEILQQAAGGLNAAHRLGIIHGDLKPDNIFLTRSDGGELVVKVADFGIAKLRESAMHTQTGMVLGTPAYTSCEQAWGMRSDQLDARSDIYSLGVVVYEMLSGRVPFHSVTLFGYLCMHMLEEPPPFRAVALNLRVPPKVEAVVMKALKKEREERYQSALEFANAFVAAAQPVSAAEVSQPLPSTKVVVSPAVREPGAPLALPAIAQAKVDTAVQTPPPPPPARIAETPIAPPTKVIVSPAVREPGAPLPLPAIAQAKVDTAVQTPPPAPPARIAETPNPPPTKVVVSPAVREPVALLPLPAIAQAKVNTAVQTPPPAPPARIAEAPNPPPTKVVVSPAAREPGAPLPLPAIAQAKVDTAVQTPPPAPPARIAEAPIAPPQRKRPVAASIRPPAAAGAPQFRTTSKSPGKMKFLAIAVVALILIVAGVRYFSQHGSKRGSISSSAKAGPSQGEVRVNPKDGLKYVWIPPGTFMMGCSPGDSDCGDEEKPPHQVTITKGFWMGQTAVTVGAYKRFVGATGRQMPYAPYFNSGWVNENMPIIWVSWDDAHDYCTWAGGLLPTEAEWEYAARAGSTEARYGPIDEIAWYSKNSGGKTQEVRQKSANGFGLHDMLGNVWEWVNDWYDENYYKNSPSQDPAGPTSGQMRVLRGGSWDYTPRNVRVSGRNRLMPPGASNYNGFRCGGEVFPP